MGTIKVENIKIYAHHGCLPEETIIGSDYRVDVSVTADFSRSASSDQLEHTADYVTINTIVKEEMQVPSKLLEHVAQRVIDRIFKELPIVSHTEVQVSKVNPPIGGDVAKVTIILSEKRS
ncbi:dihydroneopterin aldolase [Maribacter sp. 2-571]|uniref:dihydroneopterin aldolase n=1 Tax=Maribacter sp. 2-571 TaxID=3417569 RepID=UPI003D356BF0